MPHLYKELATRVAKSIDQGVYLPGDRLPGVRIASRNEGISPATVVAAYQSLEIDGYIESKPRAGFFVRPRHSVHADEPTQSTPAKRPKAVSGQGLVLELIQNMSVPGVVQLGANVPDSSYLPTQAISKELKKVANTNTGRLGSYEVPPGLPALRAHLARRMADLGSLVDPDDIIITNGCQEAVYLSLKSVTQPGDVVAVESPTYYGLLQALDSLGLKALEIPTHPRDGVSVEALRLAFEQWPVKACVLVPNFGNPLGATLPDENKSDLMDLLRLNPEVTLIEDDIYGDLNFSGRRPSIIKGLDLTHQVIYCSSYSKSLSAGLRIGWAVNAKHKQTLAYQKFVNNCSTSIVNQLTTASLLNNGSYERHLRGMRLALDQSMRRLTEKAVQCFPTASRFTRPQGGMSLWVELPKQINTTALFHAALAVGISIAPGRIFSTNPKKYQHCMRMNAAVGWSTAVERAVEQLGLLINQQLETGSEQQARRSEHD